MSSPVKAIIYHLENGQQVEHISIEFKDGKIFVDPPGKLDNFLINGEFIIGKGSKRLSIKTDGAEFVRNIPFAFTGTYYRGSLV